MTLTSTTRQDKTLRCMYSMHVCRCLLGLRCTSLLSMTRVFVCRYGLVRYLLDTAVPLCLPNPCLQISIAEEVIFHRYTWASRGIARIEIVRSINVKNDEFLEFENQVTTPQLMIFLHKLNEDASRARIPRSSLQQQQERLFLFHRSRRVPSRRERR